MVDRVLEWIEPAFAEWGLLIVFVATLLESGVFIASILPGESVLLLAGFFSSPAVASAADGDGLQLGAVLLVALAGAVLGDVVGYGLGRFAGRPIVRTVGRYFFLPERRLPLLERYIHQYGARAIVLGRFAPFLRSIRTLVAGTARMPFWRFLVADLAGTAIWTTAIVLVGFVLGESWRVARGALGAGGAVVLVVLVAAFAATWRSVARRFERELTEQANAAAQPPAGLPVEDLPADPGRSDRANG